MPFLAKLRNRIYQEYIAAVKLEYRTQHQALLRLELSHKFAYADNVRGDLAGQLSVCTESIAFAGTS